MKHSNPIPATQKYLYIFNIELIILRWQPNVAALSRCFESDLLLVPSPHLWTPFKKPTKFIGGEKSGYIPRDSHSAIRSHFPAAEFAYVSGAGHWVHADNPKGFMDKLLPFLLEEPL